MSFFSYHGRGYPIWSYCTYTSWWIWHSSHLHNCWIDCYGWVDMPNIKSVTDAIQSQLPNMVKRIVESVLTGLNTKITELQTENNSLRERVTILERGWVICTTIIVMYVLFSSLTPPTIDSNQSRYSSSNLVRNCCHRTVEIGIMTSTTMLRGNAQHSSSCYTGHYPGLALWTSCYYVFSNYHIYRLVNSLVVECWLRVREVPDSISSQGTRHTKDVIQWYQ